MTRHEPPQARRLDPPGSGELVERSGLLEELDALFQATTSTSHGRVVAIGGEAGAGKTALVRRFCAEAEGTPLVLTGACEPLHTARPFGPFVEVADTLGGELAAVARNGRPDEIASALLVELDRSLPVVLVLEDLHWADEASLDVLRLLARRVESRSILVLATYRDDEVDRSHPFRLLLGDLPGALVRMWVPPLSLEAVVDLGDAAGLDGDELYRKTGGNPFFVTEILAAPAETIPDTVRDAVLARVERLGPDRRAVLEAIAVTSPRTEIWLLEALVPDASAALDRCLESGVVVSARDTVSFRHELARLAIEGSIAAGRTRGLHRRTLELLEEGGGHTPDPARLARHAEQALDPRAVLVYAPAAAELASSAGAHGEAAAQYARALAFAESMAPDQHADMLERHSLECHLSNNEASATESGRAAVAAFRELGDHLREAGALLNLATVQRIAGLTGDSTASVAAALDLLAEAPAGREQATAYAATAQIAMCNGDSAQMFEAASRALELAEETGDVETLAHVLTTVGTMEMESPETRAAGREKLDRSIRLARENDLGAPVPRAYNNLTYEAFRSLDLAMAKTCISEAVEYTTQHGLEIWRRIVLGSRAELELAEGRWDEAADTIAEALAGSKSGVPRLAALVALGQLRARRGDPDPWGPLDEAMSIARPAGELQVHVGVAAARAEAAWLEGRFDVVAAETDALVERARLANEEWALRDLVLWRFRAGIPEEPAPGDTSPSVLEISGQPTQAAERWAELGFRYESALALAGCDDEESLRRSLDELRALGARAAAMVVTRRLRERGARGIPRGPRSATSQNPAQLTRREVEVAALVADGLSDAEIAARLYLAEKTVGHHVSSILRKLGVARRGQVAAEAARIGLER
jgi:DNA-binding CsgD family transcriptional regulator